MDWFRPQVISEGISEEEEELPQEQRVADHVGFSNLGNTCFAAASVQLLRSATDVPWNKGCSFVGEGTNPGFGDWLKELKRTRPDMINGQQQDAAEFCLSLMDDKTEPFFTSTLETTIVCPCSAKRTRTESTLFVTLPLPTNWLKNVEVTVHLNNRAELVTVKVDRCCQMKEVLARVQDLFPSHPDLRLTGAFQSSFFLFHFE
jgi:hypothetical protein